MPGRFAAIFAPSRYLDKKLASLATPKVDIQALARVLRDPEIGNFEVVETCIDCPHAEMRSGIADFFHFKKPYDFLLFYYAGIGLLDGANGIHLATTDTRPDSLAETAIAADYVCGWMNRSFARRQLLVIDCPLVTLTSAKPDSQAEVGPAFRGNGRWRMVLAASGATQYELVDGSLIGDGRNSTFSDNFRRGLETGDADLDGNGLIYVEEIFAYLNERSEKLPSALRPQLWSYAGRDKFVIAATPESNRKRRRLKWDLVIGAVMVPAVTLLLGWQADAAMAIGASSFFVLVYLLLYVFGE